ncbi:MAG TPA: hypothetical protein P5137_05735 [Candidatus Brocadiia bacterium]|nr:hypothetical protein [Candidatus Brocadiia bacterium]
MRFRNATTPILALALAAVAALSLAACSLTPKPAEGNYASLWEASLRAAQRRGFIIESEDRARGVITARRPGVNGAEEARLEMRFSAAPGGYRVDPRVSATLDTPASQLPSARHAFADPVGQSTRHGGRYPYEPSRNHTEEQAIQSLITEEMNLRFDVPGPAATPREERATP